VYLRATVRRTKGGELVRYLQLAHNERNERGVPVARVIHNFGREDRLDREALARLVRSIQRFLGAEETLRAQAPEGFRFLGAPEAGGPHVLSELWSQLGIGKAISRVAGRGRGRSGVERAIFAMVCQRCLEPASKLEASRWLGRDVVVDGIAAAGDDELYRAMDFLLACSERVQESVFFSLANLLNLEVDVIFFDTTSTYFEVDVDEGASEDDERAEASLRRLGHSKDHRPDLPQVVIGLAVTREGIPVRVWVWPGNTNDQTVIEQVKDDLRGWRLGRCVWVVDRGFSSDANLRYLTRGGGHWIAGGRMRDGSPDAQAALARPGRYQSVRDNLRVKDVRLGEADGARRFVVCHNPAEAERDKAERGTQIARLEAELARIEQVRRKAKTAKTREAHTRAECALRDHPTLSRYPRQTASGRLLIDRRKVAAEERLDGKYLLSCSDPDLSAEDIALGYKNLREAERSFRDLKTTLELRPVFHRLEHRIRAHVVVCWLALLLIRIAERTSGHSRRRIATELQRLHLVTLQGEAGTVQQTTRPTDAQRAIPVALEVEPPPRTTALEPA
jgi:hypothetical protein